MIRKLWAHHWFALLIPVLFALAWVAPGLAAKGGVLRPEFTTRAAVALIFVLQGLVLPLASVRAALGQVRLHGVVQGMTFIVFPLLGWCITTLATPWISEELRTGLLFLTVLPSTVSSAAVLTAAANGNTAGAICNSVLSSLGGVLMTPMLVALLLHDSITGNSLPNQAGSSVVFELAKVIIIPLLVGQLLRLRLGDWATRQKRRIGMTSSGLILFIVFAAFCDASRAEIWTSHGWRMPVQAGLGAILVFLAATILVRGFIQIAGLGTADAVAAEFCAVQKTLASGVPMAGVIFGGDARTGLILLPLLIYHPLQLAIHGALATRRGRMTT